MKIFYRHLVEDLYDLVEATYSPWRKETHA